MDAALFTKMLSDKSIINFQKMQYKYGEAIFSEFMSLLKDNMYKELPLKDFNGNNLVYLESFSQIELNSIKLLLKPQSGQYGIKAMEDEIFSTFDIENIESSRDSIRKILNGYAPVNNNENQIFCMKKGLEFILENDITEENLSKLYKISVEDYLEDENKRIKNNLYRHDDVFIVGGNIEHKGIHHSKLPEYMASLIAFINNNDNMNDLIKSAVIHFYFSYLHPYFDGNGRTARLLHLWYLIKQGYSSAMFVPISAYVSKSRKKYYEAYTQIEENLKIGKILDATPFITYFTQNVYNKLKGAENDIFETPAFQTALANGKITEKEHDLWNFVLSAYGKNEFSTKQLEKDFGNAAYATIRSFVLKFKALNLLADQKYGNRVKYHIC